MRKVMMNSHSKFEIIAIVDVFPIIQSMSSYDLTIKKGTRFIISEYEFNYDRNHLRLPYYLLCDRSKFMRIEDFRDHQLAEILK